MRVISPDTNQQLTEGLGIASTKKEARQAAAAAAVEVLLATHSGFQAVANAFASSGGLTSRKRQRQGEKQQPQQRRRRGEAAAVGNTAAKAEGEVEAEAGDGGGSAGDQQQQEQQEQEVGGGNRAAPAGASSHEEIDEDHHLDYEAVDDEEEDMYQGLDSDDPGRGDEGDDADLAAAAAASGDDEIDNEGVGVETEGAAGEAAADGGRGALATEESTQQQQQQQGVTSIAPANGYKAPWRSSPPPAAAGAVAAAGPPVASTTAAAAGGGGAGGSSGGAAAAAGGGGAGSSSVLRAPLILSATNNNSSSSSKPAAVHPLYTDADLVATHPLSTALLAKLNDLFIPGALPQNVISLMHRVVEQQLNLKVEYVNVGHHGVTVQASNWVLDMPGAAGVAAAAAAAVAAGEGPYQEQQQERQAGVVCSSYGEGLNRKESKRLAAANLLEKVLQENPDAADQQYAKTLTKYQLRRRQIVLKIGEDGLAAAAAAAGVMSGPSIAVAPAALAASASAAAAGSGGGVTGVGAAAFLGPNATTAAQDQMLGVGEDQGALRVGLSAAELALMTEGFQLERYPRLAQHIHDKQLAQPTVAKSCTPLGLLQQYLQKAMLRSEEEEQHVDELGEGVWG